MDKVDDWPSAQSTCVAITQASQIMTGASINRDAEQCEEEMLRIALKFTSLSRFLILIERRHEGRYRLRRAQAILEMLAAQILKEVARGHL